MKTVKQALIVLGLMVGAVSLFSFLPTAGAQLLSTQDQIIPGETDLRSLVISMINYALGFLGLIAVIMVMYGGITYVISAGNDEAVGNAKKIIMFALIGLVIIMLAFAMVNWVLGLGVGTP